MNPYLFVVGCPRSGTTLLRRMLDCHPQIAVSNDANFLFNVLDGDSESDLPLTSRLVEETIASRRVRRMGLTAERIRQLAAGVARYRDFASAVYSEYARVHGKELAGDKTPHYTKHLPVVHRLFPAAKMIHIIRDGRDVTLSAVEWAPRKIRGPAKFELWLRDPVAACALWWKRYVTVGMEEGQKLGPEIYCEIRYEELVAEPEQVLRKLVSFLGLPFAPEMVRPEKSGESSGTDASERSLAQEAQRRRETSPDQNRIVSTKAAWLPPTPGLRDWRTQMAGADVEMFEALAGDLLTGLGYERAIDRTSPEVKQMAATHSQWWAEKIESKKWGPKSAETSVSQ